MRKAALLLPLLLALVVPPDLSSQNADPLAPTLNTKSAGDIDREWQQSVAKYDGERNRLLAEADQQAHDGPYRPDWATLTKYQQPQWYKDAKFGIFIHWGVYSVPGAENEWYPRNMYRPSEGAYKNFREHFAKGDESKGYKDLIPLFKAEHFDAAEWAKVFKESGAQYVVPVAEHHDGFSMYDSGLSDWTVVKLGPRRDTLGELAKAIRAEGLHFGLSSHRAEHNFFYDGGRSIRSDVNDPKYASLYGPAHEWFEAKEDNHTLIYTLNWKAAVRDFERGQQDHIIADHWQTDTSISDKSWGYIENDTFKSSEFLVHQLIDIVSKNGNLLLNFGPKSDGTIPDEIRTRLLEMGAWLKVNGEAIYGTTPWKIYGEGPTKVVAGAFHDTDTKPYTPEDFRFTAKGDTVYAIGMACPADGKGTIHALGIGQQSASLSVTSVELLGSSEKVTWRQTADALEISLPQGAACKYAYSLKLTPGRK